MISKKKLKLPVAIPKIMVVFKGFDDEGDGGEVSWPFYAKTLKEALVAINERSDTYHATVYELKPKIIWRGKK